MTDVKRHKILAAARAVFLRYGYKRVSMNDIAEAAGVSRPALYLLFKNKEEIFGGVFLQWANETMANIEQEMGKAGTPDQKLLRAFEIWAVRPFEMVLKTPEAKELIDCSFAFAQEALKQGYRQFEATIVPVVALLAKQRPAKTHLASEQIAHVLASAVRGFKQTAAKPAELRSLIKQLLVISFGLDGKF